ncbi:Ras-related protein Rap-2b [Armadillidium vulgare]|nr:Ras-related protein Rap-2b [Armadillidium vulgare]
MALAHMWSCPFVEASAKNRLNVNEVFAEIVREMNKIKARVKDVDYGRHWISHNYISPSIPKPLVCLCLFKCCKTKHCEWFYIEYKANPIGCNRRCDAHANTNEYFGMNGKKKVVA